MGIAILGTGGYVPENVITNKDLENIVDTTDEWILSRTGISERRIAKSETSTEMAYKASMLALESANVKAEDLGLIICSTFTPEALVPGTSNEVQRLIGATCPAFDLNAACSGFIFALHVAKNMFAGKPILVIGAEKLSKLVDWTDRNTCVLFGDGAGALIIGNSEDDSDSDILYTSISSYPDNDQVLLVEGTNKNVESQLTPSYIVMNGTEVFKFATSVINESVNACIETLGLDKDDIDWIVPHQANTRIVKNASSKLDIPYEKFYLNIATTGNTSSASVPFALHEMNEKKLLKKGDLVILTAFGGGLSAATALIRW